MKSFIKKHKKIIIILTAVFLVLFSAYCFFQNNFLVTSEYTVSDEEIPEGFDGFTLAQVSDFHNTHSKILQKDILSELERIKPDIILLTGDYIDCRKTDIPLAVSYAEKLIKIAPVYFSTGNHEAYTEDFPVLERELLSLGVNVLRNSSSEIEKNGEKIYIMGLDDPTMEECEDKYATIRETIDNAPYDDSVYTVTLSHRPELFSVYCEKGLDLILSGHAHGGQFRIPFIGGLYIPTEGLFPKYTEGLHKENGTHMVISRGIGASIFPIRLNNRPELVTVTLESE